MTAPPKRRGDQAEREVTQLLNTHLGTNARRAFGAGRTHDEGDIVGVPYTAIQVANRTTRIADAIRHKPLEAEQQRTNAHVPFAATFLRLRGGAYRVILTPEQFFTLWREAINGKR
jgi:Holliday junction resolvase